MAVRPDSGPFIGKEVGVMADTEVQEIEHVQEEVKVRQPKQPLPGKMQSVVDDLAAFIIKADMNKASVDVDRGAQNLMDLLRGTYGDEVAGTFLLPTIDKLVEYGLASDVDTKVGEALAAKVHSYMVLAEDLGLSDEQVQDIKDLLSEWDANKPKPDKMGRRERDPNKPHTEPDIPFGIRVTYNGTEVGKFGNRNGATYWSNVWSKVQKEHYQEVLGNEDRFSPAIRNALGDAKTALLNGAQSVQAWDYVVDRIESE